MPKIIYSVVFTGKTPYGNGFRGEDWYAFRYKVFRDFTLKSLINQTDHDFLIWLQFRPEEKDNPTTAKIEEALKESGLQYLMTFHGPIMMEDKATWHNIDLLDRAEKSLKEFPEIKDDWIVEVALDSDDMVHKKLTEILKTKEMGDRKAFYMKKGYMYSVDNKLADWNNPYSMSIYAIVYPNKFFFDSRLHFAYQRGLDSHEQIPARFNAELLPDNMFCALYHAFNISTVWEHEYRGKEYFSEEEISSILKDFK